MLGDLCVSMKYFVRGETTKKINNSRKDLPCIQLSIFKNKDLIIIFY
jgi:hypothetical protein